MQKVCIHLQLVPRTTPFVLEIDSMHVAEPSQSKKVMGGRVTRGETPAAGIDGRHKTGGSHSCRGDERVESL